MEHSREIWLFTSNFGLMLSIFDHMVQVSAQFQIGQKIS